MSEQTAPVTGICASRFEPLQELFGQLFQSGRDLGASLAVTVGGEFVVDLWGGWADEGRSKRWQRDTIACVFSTTKSMLPLAALVLVDRGELDLDAPVADYWPEFGAAGKSGVLVRHVLAHTSGVSGFAEPVTVEDLYDWEKCTSLLAAQEPWWTPGTASGYHAMTVGYLVGEVVRRISGRSFNRFFAEEIAGPLEADFHIGLPRSEFARVSNLIPLPPADYSTLDPHSVAIKTMANGTIHDARVSWRDDWRLAVIPAGNGHGNARSVARLQSVVANGGEVGDLHLLSPATIARIFDVQSDGNDLVLNVPITMGIGYALPKRESLPFLPQGRICTWGGWGGSIVIVDVDRRMTLAYVMNKMSPGIVGTNAAALASCFYEIVND